MKTVLLPVFLVLPSLALYWWFSARSFLQSRSMRFVASYFFGQFASAWCVYLLAVASRHTTAFVLEKSVVVFDVTLACVFLFVIYKHKDAFLKVFRQEAARFSIHSAIIFACCLLFSVLLFAPQLHRVGDLVYRSQVYWDFPAQALVLQSFIAGDNFPPELESFAGVPMPYHYFSFLLIAIYQAAGLHLVDAVNMFSILNFALVLFALVGLCEELFLSTGAGVLAAALAVTSSSFHFVHYLSKQTGQPLLTILHGLLFNTLPPDMVAFGGPAGYNGNMFNLFYFVEERQLFFGVLFLLVWAAVFHSIHRLSPFLCVLAGFAIALFFKWHFYAVTALLASLAFLCLVAKGNRGRFALIFLAAAIMFAAEAVLIKAQTAAFLSPIVQSVPKFNPEYSTNPPNYLFSVPHLIWYYVYAYGLKIPFFLAGVYLIRKRFGNTALLLLAFVLPAFVMLNTIQLSPLSIFENHKWLRPMNMFVDIAAAFALLALIKTPRRPLRILWPAALFLLTFSGLIEMMPYFNASPAKFCFSLPGEFQKALQRESHPSALFLGGHTYEVNLAGRRTFAANPAGETASPMMYNNFISPALLAERNAVMKAVSNAPTREAFCSLAGSIKADFVELTGALHRTLGVGSHFWAKSAAGRPVHFYDVRRICENSRLK